MRPEVFLDSAFAIALSVAKDDYHKKAIELANEITDSEINMVTTRAVILEIGNALAKTKYRSAAVQLIKSLEEDPKVIIIHLTEEIFSKAFALYQKSLDKDWGITDCASFIVMEECKINEALTTDEHFRQAGFKPLLLE